MRRLSKLAVIFLAVLLLAAALAVGALLLVDPSVFRGPLEKQASAAFGRPFRINGPIDLQRSLRPRFVVRGITIDNPDWATGDHFARADQVAVQVALMPLLRGRLKVMDVVFSGVEIFIENGPGGANNYTFGEGIRIEDPWRMPSTERMLIRDMRIHFPTDTGDDRRFEIAAARLWNLPGQPERIEAQGEALGMPYRLEFTAEPDAGLSGPGNPWTVKAELQGAGLTLSLEGRMARAFAWQQFEGYMAISGEKIGPLAPLFDLEMPKTGPFAIRAAVHTTENTLQFQELNGHFKGIAGQHDIAIADGDLTAGFTAPLALNLRGALDDSPLTLGLSIDPTPKSADPTAPRPVSAHLEIADSALDVEGTLAKADSGRPLMALDGQFQGERLDTLARLLGRDLTATGAYRFAFHVDMGAGHYELTRLAGEIRGIKDQDLLQVTQGRARLEADGSVETAVEAQLNKIPLSLAFKSGPAAADEAGRRTRPLELKATLPGTQMKGTGFVAPPGEQPRLKLGLDIQGDRLETLGILMGIALPPIGPYAVKADLLSAEGVHNLQNIRARMGTDIMTGQLKWQDQAPRPLLTGRLTAERLTPAALRASKTPTAGNPGNAVDLGWFQALDARVDVAIAHLADSPIPVKDIEVALTIAEERLKAPFRAMIADAPLEGRLDVHQPGDTPQMTLHAAIDKIDAGRALKKIELPGVVDGAIGAVRFEGRSNGRTWPALIERAVLKVQLHTADIHYAGQFIGRPIDLIVETAELTNAAGRPLSATFKGEIQGVPFDARADTGRLAELASGQAPLPIRLNLKAADFEFSGRGTVARPVGRNVFDLEHELSGDEIEGVDPLIDMALPLQGAFEGRGTITGRGNRTTYEEVLRVGQSHFQMTMHIEQAAARHRITAQITSEDLYLEDVKMLAESDTPSATGETEYLIPDYTLPLDYMRLSDLEIDIRARRVHSAFGDLGELVTRVTIDDGHFVSTSTITNPKGARLRRLFEVNAAADPPTNHFELDGTGIDYGYTAYFLPTTAFEGGTLDFNLHLTGTGSTRRKFLDHADGRLTMVGGSGLVHEGRIDLWAADLIPTMLSPKWKKGTTEINCMVARVGLVDGLATIDNMLLDTRRVTIAGSGAINLKNEALDVYIAPRPKDASLVSLANPVHITGTLSDPDISVAKLPGRSGRRLARTGILAGLINPLFLITAFSDTGTIGDDACAEAIQSVEAADEESAPIE